MGRGKNGEGGLASFHARSRCLGKHAIRREATQQPCVVRLGCRVMSERGGVLDQQAKEQKIG